VYRFTVTPEGDVSGYLVIAFYPDRLIERLPPQITGAGNVTLIDHDGTILFQQPNAHPTYRRHFRKGDPVREVGEPTHGACAGPAT
jgi:hypothetical protein